MPRHAPNAAHQAFMLDLDMVDQRFKAMPPLERVALAAQFVGMLVAEVPSNEYSAAQVMRTVSDNMSIGNAQAGSAIASMSEGLS